MKKALAAILVFWTLAALCACSMLSKPSDEEIRAAVEALLPDAYTATYIVYGPGIELDPDQEIDENWTVPHYIRVAKDYPYQSERSIRALVKKVFSADYAEEMLTYAFVNTEIMSRYVEYGGILAMDVVKHKALNMVKDFYVNTLHVIKGNEYACEAEIDCTLGTGEKETLTLQLVKENEKWLFDGPAY